MEMTNSPETAQVGRASPSRSSSGYILNTATSWNQATECRWWWERREAGREARRIDFSCTWNEKRKNTREEFTCTRMGGCSGEGVVTSGENVWECSGEGVVTSGEGVWECSGEGVVVRV